MKNLTIKSKLWILTSITALGFLIIGITVSSKLNTLQTEYENSKTISSKLGALKSILIGGLMVNSATNVFVLDNSNKKPLKTISSGIKKVKEFAKKLKKVSPDEYNLFKEEYIAFTSIAFSISQKGLNSGTLLLSDSRKLLKPWRALKGKILSYTPIFKKAGKKAQEIFYDELSSLGTIVIIVITIIFCFYFILSFIISNSISNYTTPTCQDNFL